MECEIKTWKRIEEKQKKRDSKTEQKREARIRRKKNFERILSEGSSYCLVEIKVDTRTLKKCAYNCVIVFFYLKSINILLGDGRGQATLAIEGPRSIKCSIAIENCFSRSSSEDSITRRINIKPPVLLNKLVLGFSRMNWFDSVLSSNRIRIPI